MLLEKGDNKGSLLTCLRRNELLSYQDYDCEDLRVPFHQAESI